MIVSDDLDLRFFPPDDSQYAMIDVINICKQTKDEFVLNND